MPIRGSEQKVLKKWDFKSASSPLYRRGKGGHCAGLSQVARTPGQPHIAHGGNCVMEAPDWPLVSHTLSHLGLCPLPTPDVL